MASMKIVARIRKLEALAKTHKAGKSTVVIYRQLMLMNTN
jgi:hypothetical protein